MRTFILAVTGLSLGVAACSYYPTSVLKKARARVALVSVSIPRSLETGKTARATARITDASGATLTDRAVAWYTSSASIATVSDSGLVSAVAPGDAVVSAVSDGVAGQVTLAVIPPPLTSVATVLVAISPPSVMIGQSAYATATLEDANGNPLSGRPVTWQSLSPSIASVSASGDVSAVGAGTATITASSEGRTGLAALTVNAPPPIPVASISVSPATAALQVGGTMQLSVVTRDANNNVLTGRLISWSSSNAIIGTVSALGVVTAIAAGSVQITASSEGRTASASIAVSAPAPVPVSSVSISPATATLQVGGTVQLSAVTRDANNNILTGRLISWSSSNANLDTVSTLGLVTAIAAGTAQITASSEGQTASASVVSAPAPVPVASVSVSPATATLPVGGAVQLSAVTRDASNNVLTGRAISWSSANSSMASIGSNGLVTAVGAGTTSVTATSEGKSGSASVTVTAVPPPPPTGSVEPPGMTVITERPFSAMNEDGWTDGSIIVSDPTAPKSPSSIGQIVFPAGFTGGNAPAQTYPNKTFSYRTQYIAVWMKISSNWQGHQTGANKILHVYVGGSNHVVVNLWGSGSGMMQAGILLQGIVNNGSGGTSANWYSNLGPTGEIVRGQWHHLEVLLVGNTNGAANGSVDWWLDGVKNGSYSGIEYVPGDGLWEGLNWSPTWGGSGDVVSSTMTMSFDHFYMSGK